MFCTKCGAYVPDGQKFCTSCGAPLDDGASANGSASAANSAVGVGADPLSYAPDIARQEYQTGVAQPAASQASRRAATGQAGQAAYGSPSYQSDQGYGSQPYARQGSQAYAQQTYGHQGARQSSSAYAQQGTSRQPAYMPPVEVPGVNEPKPAHGGKGGNGKKTALIVAAVVAAIVLGGGAGYYFGVYQPQQAKIERQEKEAEEDAIKHSKHPVRITASGSGWDTSTGASKLPVQVTGTDVDGKNVDQVFYVDSDGNGIKLMQGKYTLKVAASPLGSNGEIWDVPNIAVSVKLGDALKKDEKLDLRDDAKFELGDPVNAVDVEPGDITTAQNYARDGGCDSADDADALANLATSARNGAVTSYNNAVSAARKKSLTYDGDVFTFQVPDSWAGNWDVQVDQGTYSGVKNGLYVVYNIYHDGVQVHSLELSNHYNSAFNVVGYTKNVGKSTNLALGSYGALSGDSDWEYIVNSIHIK